LIAPAGVGRKCAYLLLAVVDVDEPAFLDDPDSGAGEASADIDLQALVGDDPGGLHLAHQRVRWVARFVVLTERELGRLDGRAIALGRGLIADSLVGALVVVVEAEAVEQKLELGQVTGAGLVGQPVLERAVEAFELAERLRMGGTSVDQLDAEPGQAALELDREPKPAAVKLTWLSDKSCLGRPWFALACRKQRQAASPVELGQARAESRKRA
jgi:hypothetical protein